MLANWLSGTVGTVAAVATSFLAFVGDWVKLSFLTSVSLDFVPVVSFAVCFSFVGSTRFSLFSVEPLLFWFIVVVFTTLSLLPAGCVLSVADVVASAVDSVAAAVDAAGLPLLWAAGLPLLWAAGLPLLWDNNATSVPEISVLPPGFALVSVPVPVCVSPSALTVVAPPNINPPKTTLPTINEAAPPPFFFFLIEYFNFLFRLFLDMTSPIPFSNIWPLIKNNNQFYSSNLILFFLYFYFSKNKANLKSSYQLPCLINYVHFIKYKIKFQDTFSKIFIRLYKLLPSSPP